MTVEHILARQRAGRSSRIEPEQTPGEAARLLVERHIGAVIVADQFRPVLGILSERDIVRALAARGAAALDEPVAGLMTEKVVSCTAEAGINELMETDDRRASSGTCRSSRAGGSSASSRSATS